MRLRWPHQILLFAAIIAMLFSTTACADDGANTLLQRVAAKARASQTLRATLTLSRQTAGSPAKTATASVLLMKPNLASIRFTGNDEAVPAQLASDGITLSCCAPLQPSVQPPSPRNSPTSNSTNPFENHPSASHHLPPQRCIQKTPPPPCSPSAATPHPSNSRRSPAPPNL
jgi:hypothetical protein